MLINDWDKPAMQAFTFCFLSEQSTKQSMCAVKGTPDQMLLKM